MKTPKFINAHLPVVLLFLAGITANAQSLPAKQKAGLHAPAGIKIDGKATEWDNKFQAYNHATDVFYTLANDNDKLYLAIQVTDPLIIRKIINGGITFKIDTGKATDNSGIAITYPIFDQTNHPAINLNDKPSTSTNPASDRMRLDSFVTAINKQFTDKSKEIKIHGISSLTDGLISIYNQDNVNAAVRFDANAAYVYELSVPLKYLGISASGISKFKYTVTLNGSSQIDGITRTTVNNVDVMRISVGVGAPAIPSRSDMAILKSPTDFDGEYTLVD